MITYDTIILLSWAAFLLVWGVTAFFVKRDVRGGGYAAVWQRYWVLRLAVAALIGNIVGIGMFVVISIMFALRIDKEEKIMLELFPRHYPEYQKRTKRLVPFVW